jgi:hypothetical protein
MKLCANVQLTMHKSPKKVFRNKEGFQKYCMCRGFDLIIGFSDVAAFKTITKGLVQLSPAILDLPHLGTKCRCFQVLT